MDMHDWPYIKKSARRKKRLVKKDFDKKLIKLSRRRQELSNQRCKLPPVVLDKPYQRGWMRQFVLRDDIARSPKAQFYNELLSKINTYQWHYDRSFKRRKVRKGEYHYYDVNNHKLQELSPQDFHGDKLKLSDAEKRCFYLTEKWDNRYNRWETKYVLTEAWRYVLVIKPHMVYTARQVDELLERELSRVHKYIDWNNFQPRLWKLMGGKDNYWKEDYVDQPRNFDELDLKNSPRYTNKEAYLDY